MPQDRELEERKLVSALAVDEGERTTVTAITGVRVSEDEKPEVLTGSGDSLAAACRELRGGSSRRAYLGQAEQLLLGESQDLEKALDFVTTDRELRLDTLLYIVKGNAGEALSASGDRGDGRKGPAWPDHRRNIAPFGGGRIYPGAGSGSRKRRDFKTRGVGGIGV